MQIAEKNFFEEAVERWDALDTDRLVAMLKERFTTENIEKYFDIDEGYQNPQEPLGLTSGNSIYMKFRTLRESFKAYYSSDYYNVVLILGMRSLEVLDDEARLALRNLAKRDNADKIVIWSCRPWPITTIQNLKDSKVEVLRLREREIRHVKFIANFVPEQGVSYLDAVSLNLAVDLLLKRLKKLFHLILSEIAAPIYDEIYGKARVATLEYMGFEKALVEQVTDGLKTKKRQSIAVDIGCGTGRHTFPLASKFDEVYAYDFSPRMIEMAENQKKGGGLRNLIFVSSDIEYDDLVDEDKFIGDGTGAVDLVLASFGMGSFVEDTLRLLRRIHLWLRPGGRLMISFYNADSIVSQVTPNWRDTSLSAHLDSESNTLKVQLAADIVFHIFCKPYSDDVRKAVASLFEIEKNLTFPTLMALMPNSLLEDETASELFKELDRSLAESKRFRLGYYVTIIAKKPESVASASSTIEDLLVEEGAEYSYVEHSPILSSSDLLHVLDGKKGLLVKTVVLKDRSDETVYVIVLEYGIRLDRRRFAQYIGLSPNRLEFSSDKFIAANGFPVGGVAPFGFGDAEKVNFFIDGRLRRNRRRWFLIASGDPRRTIRISSKDFRRLTSAYQKFETTA